jgi:hypothetical protein
MFIWDTLKPKAASRLGKAVLALRTQLAHTGHDGIRPRMDSNQAGLTCSLQVSLICYADICWLPARPKRRGSPWFPLCSLQSLKIWCQETAFSIWPSRSDLFVLCKTSRHMAHGFCSEKSQGANDSELSAQNSINSENQWFVGLCMLDYERKSPKDWEAANHGQPKKKRALNS